MREINKWRPALSEDKWQQAKLVVIDDHVEDKLLCMLTSLRNFMVRDYINHLRHGGPKKNWTDLVWNKVTPPRVNAFMWRVFSGAIPVDSNIQRRGIELPLKCVCCARPQVDMLSHLLIKSDITSHVLGPLCSKISEIAAHPIS